VARRVRDWSILDMVIESSMNQPWSLCTLWHGLISEQQFIHRTIPSHISTEAERASETS
jgi:hypothetical protein